MPTLKIVVWDNIGNVLLGVRPREEAVLRVERHDEAVEHQHATRVRSDEE